MVSWMDVNEDPQRYEGAGLNLNWGEYYVADDKIDSDDDDETGDVSSCEEAEEIGEDELLQEENEALVANHDARYIYVAEANFDQLDDEATTPSSPSLMGMPDIILQKILHYTKDPSEICVLERVCKRIRRMTTDDDFWYLHPTFNGSYEYYYEPDEDSFYRDLAFRYWGLRKIRKYQRGSARNAIIDVLGDKSECVADTLRNVSADILSRMNHLGPAAHFRLRGDTLGYLFELLQGYMISRLKIAVLLAIHSNSVSPYEEKIVVCREDMALAFQMDSFQNPLSSYFSSPRPVRCNVANGYHGQIASAITCSCCLSSSSGVVWRWPLDDCHEVLPPEAGRRIIRRLAFISGILEMSNDAFIVAEAELLHTLGMLLVDAYETSVEMVKDVPFLNAEDELTYNTPTDSVDMFTSPPPPFHPAGYKWYTPGDRDDMRKESRAYKVCCREKGYHAIYCVRRCVDCKLWLYRG